LLRLHASHGRDAQFLFVYVSEAPDRGGWTKAPPPPGAGPEGPARHAARVRAEVEGRELPFPCLLDDAGSETERAYGAWPRRLVLVGGDGRVVLDLGSGAVKQWDLQRVADELDRLPGRGADRGGRPATSGATLAAVAPPGRPSTP
jgi:hypothetical protein